MSVEGECPTCLGAGYICLPFDPLWEIPGTRRVAPCPDCTEATA